MTARELKEWLNGVDDEEEFLVYSLGKNKNIKFVSLPKDDNPFLTAMYEAVLDNIVSINIS